jgi:hypothetical protein
MAGLRAEEESSAWENGISVYHPDRRGGELPIPSTYNPLTRQRYGAKPSKNTGNPDRLGRVRSIQLPGGSLTRILEPDSKTLVNPANSCKILESLESSGNPKIAANP